MSRFSDIPQFTRTGSYEVDTGLDYLEEWLESLNRDNRTFAFEMDPDFQRGHVWSEEQQIRYMEFFFRGGRTGRIIYWNCPGWGIDYQGPMQLVDGKQRLTAALRFLRNEIPVFGSFRSDFTDKPRIMQDRFKMNVNDLKTRAEVLQWYLDLNTGGVVHTTDEIQKVEQMLAAERNSKPTRKSKV